MSAERRPPSGLSSSRRSRWAKAFARSSASGSPAMVEFYHPETNTRNSYGRPTAETAVAPPLSTPALRGGPDPHGERPGVCTAMLGYSATRKARGAHGGRHRRESRRLVPSLRRGLRVRALQHVLA